MVDKNPLIWMLQVNGFSIDVRQAPREIQEEAFRKGLIPSLPDDTVLTSCELRPSQAAAMPALADCGADAFLARHPTHAQCVGTAHRYASTSCRSTTFPPSLAWLHSPGHKCRLC